MRKICSKLPLTFLAKKITISFKRVAKLRKSSYLLHVYFLEQEDDRIMKRVKAACICQTLHFMLKEDVGHDYAVKLVNEEVEHYKKNLERNHTKYKIVEQTVQTDGSIILKIIKQYNSSPVGDYLN